MRRTFHSALLIAWAAGSIPVVAQVDTLPGTDSIGMRMNMDAVYARPLQPMGFANVALGGYVEANTRYEVEDGVSEGLSFQLPRLTLFVSSAIARRIRFLTEIELEEGGREVNIEFASVDLELHPLFNLRGGIIINPIGSFNQNHDGPRWTFIDRPFSSTTIIPGTWSNAGFGLYGKTSARSWTWGYEAYVSNGFDGSIVDNTEGRTWLPAAKQNPERFEESSNGVPLVTLKTAARHTRIGEIGISWMGGVYNRFEEDGLELDRRRRVDLVALDFNTKVGGHGPVINAEWVWAMVDVPGAHSPQYGRKQHGGYLDVVQTVVDRPMLGWADAHLDLALRAEFVDYNVGRFSSTGTNIGDDLSALTGGIGFRPDPGTVVRANYGWRWQHDPFDNAATRTGVVTFGLSSYF